MPTSLRVFVLCFAASTGVVAAQGPSPDVLIAGAVQAAPADQRDTATVIAVDAAGADVTLRAGTGSLVCLADNPRDEKFSVACYHKDLEPFMARGRVLAKAGTKGRGPATDPRYKEIASGALAMPREPRLLTIVEGTAFDAATGTVTNAYTRWVIYTQGATAEATGLPTTPGPGAPWLMFPGTPGAHIMISPPRPQ